VPVSTINGTIAVAIWGFSLVRCNHVLLLQALSGSSARWLLELAKFNGYNGQATKLPRPRTQLGSVTNHRVTCPLELSPEIHSWRLP
jgi:hypothetical protein